MQDYMTLASSADKGTESWNFESESYRMGKKAMGLIDEDRNFRAKEAGYLTTHYSMNPLTCTPKNDIICGRPSDKL